jgi:hypothetical protein
MEVIGGDIKKINPSVVEKVLKVEQEEGYIATVTLQTFQLNVFLCNVVFAKPGTNQMAFSSLNLYQRDTTELVFDMQDGIVSGFEMESNWVNHYRDYPQCPEDLASEILFDLFVKGWD